MEGWCLRCDACAIRKGSQWKNKAPLQKYVSGAPLERLALDILGPLPISDLGNKYLLIVEDCFSKWTEVYPIPNQEAKTVADALVHEFVSRYRVPGELHSDQGRNFGAN